jgi:hypothetical protein
MNGSPRWKGPFIVGLSLAGCTDCTSANSPPLTVSVDPNIPNTIETTIGPTTNPGPTYTPPPSEGWPDATPEPAEDASVGDTAMSADTSNTPDVASAEAASE